MNVKLFANQVLFSAKKASPTLALGGSIVLGIGAIVMACKATPKVDKLLDESRKQIKTIHEIANGESEFSENDKQKAIAIVWRNTVWGMTKAYAPTIVLEAGSIALSLWSHKAMLKRVAALSATVVTLTESIRRGRENVSERFGEEKENDIYYGSEQKKVEDTVIDEETGDEKKVKVTAKVVNAERIVSPFNVIFDDKNPNYNPGDPNHNKDFISNAETILVRRKNIEGYLFLNDARKMLGYKPIPEGQVMGWGPDDVIDLGIDHIGSQEVRDFQNGYKKCFVIDFSGLKPIIDDVTNYDCTFRCM